MLVNTHPVSSFSALRRHHNFRRAEWRSVPVQEVCKVEGNLHSQLSEEWGNSACWSFDERRRRVSAQHGHKCRWVWLEYAFKFSGSSKLTARTAAANYSNDTKASAKQWCGDFQSHVVARSTKGSWAKAPWWIYSLPTESCWKRKLLWHTGASLDIVANIWRNCEGSEILQIRFKCIKLRGCADRYGLSAKMHPNPSDGQGMMRFKI